MTLILAFRINNLCNIQARLKTDTIAFYFLNILRTVLYFTYTLNLTVNFTRAKTQTPVNSFRVKLIAVHQLSASIISSLFLDQFSQLTRLEHENDYILSRQNNLFQATTQQVRMATNKNFTYTTIKARLGLCCHNSCETPLLHVWMLLAQLSQLDCN